MAVAAVRARANVIANGEAPVSSSCQIPDIREKLSTLGLAGRTGTFVEVGAFDGDSFSNTSFLADQGWTGLYIEPIPKYYRLTRVRHVLNRVNCENCGIAPNRGTAVISMMGALSTMNSGTVEAYKTIAWARAEQQSMREVVIKTRPISEVLSRNRIPPDFDLMVIDVEGAEEPIVKDLLNTEWRPRVLIVELCDVHPDFRDKHELVESHARVRGMLLDSGYFENYVDQINTIFLLPARG